MLGINAKCSDPAVCDKIAVDGMKTSDMRSFHLSGLFTYIVKM